MEVGVKSRKKTARSVGVLVFSIGTLLGLALAGAATWGDLEAAFYGFQKMGDKPLRTLKCPVIMTSSETGEISATFKNPQDRPVQLMLRTDLSGPTLTTERTRLALAPGERKQADWTVTRDNIDLRYFIFAQVSSYPVYPFPFRQATCGIMVMNLPGLSGNQIVTWTLVASMLDLLVGLGLWQAGNPSLPGRRQQTTYAMRILAVIVLAAIFIAFRGWWLAGLLLFLLAIIMIVVIGEFLWSTTPKAGS
jgi:hypothetical protein